MRCLHVLLVLYVAMVGAAEQESAARHRLPLVDPEAPVLVSMDFDDAEFGAVLRAVVAAGGFEVEVDPAVAGRFTGSFQGVPLDRVVDRVLTAHDLVLSRVNRQLWVHPRPGPDASGLVTVVEASGQVVDLVGEIARQAAVPIVVAPGVSGTLTCELVGEPWSRALDLVLTAAGLELTVDGEVFLVHLPAVEEGAVARFTGERISLWLEEADVKDVLRTFSVLADLNVVVHPGVQGSITLELRDVHWDQALDVILRLSGLGYHHDGAVLMVYPAGTKAGVR